MNVVSGGRKVDCRIDITNESCLAHLFQYEVAENPFGRGKGDFWLCFVDVGVAGLEAIHFVRGLLQDRREIEVHFNDNGTHLVGKAMSHMNMGDGEYNPSDGEITKIALIGTSRLVSTSHPY